MLLFLRENRRGSTPLIGTIGAAPAVLFEAGRSVILLLVCFAAVAGVISLAGALPAGHPSRPKPHRPV
jgi:hypothetical protein